MGCVEISNNDRVWEILYASVFLEGKEKEEALRRYGVVLPAAAAMAERMSLTARSPQSSAGGPCGGTLRINSHRPLYKPPIIRYNRARLCGKVIV